jgi:hypothetical protein
MYLIRAVFDFSDTLFVTTILTKGVIYGAVLKDYMLNGSVFHLPQIPKPAVLLFFTAWN